jgi:predicted nuclease of predicted toxin-antitoxin system
MKLLLDQGLPRGAVVELRRSGLEAVHVGDLGMAAAMDRDILEYARSTGHIVITLDADFHALLTLTNSSRPSVVRVPIEGLRAPGLASLLEKVLGCVAETCVVAPW